MFEHEGFEQGGLEHGGKLNAAARQYGRPLDEWLDLSTGIHPNGWPVPPLPASIWSRLPEDEDGLEQAACDYYGAEHLLAVAGSQAAIQVLPQLRSPARVSVLHPGYAEHAEAWRRAGHSVMAVSEAQLNDVVAQSDVLVLIHPNNPTGARFKVAQLLDWHAQLAARGGWLVVDEAFMDVTPEHSLCRYGSRPGLVVLRSLGKFFGLAGARVGFVCAQAELLARIHARLGPWTINTPARWLATAALNDHAWQKASRRHLADESRRLHALLMQYQLAPDGGSGLFQWVRTPQAASLHELLARDGILTRLFTHPSSLRFGLPGCEREWQRLGTALARITAVDLSGASA